MGELDLLNLDSLIDLNDVKKKNKGDSNNKDANVRNVKKKSSIDVPKSPKSKV